jgi:hypothetical protein
MFRDRRARVVHAAPMAPSDADCMNARHTFRALLFGAGVAALVAARGWTHAQRDDRPSLAASIAIPGGTPQRVSVVDTATLDSLTTAISDRDPFRLTREPSAVAYTTEPDGAPLPAPRPRPPIMLSGIVGPPWAALLEGIPGHEGTYLARIGDTVARAPSALLIIRSITHDTVVVRGADTTWRLTVRRVWR